MKMKDILFKKWKNIHEKPERYDIIAEIFGTTEIEIKNILNFIDFKDKIVLDVGAGTGRLSIPISKIAERVCAIDPEEEMLNSLKEKIKKYRIKNIEIKRGTAEKIPYSDNYFDCVICAWILHYIDYKKTIKQIKRVLKKDGYLVFLDHNGNDDWEKLSIIIDPKNVGMYENRNNKLLKLIEDFHKVKRKVVNSFIRFPNIDAAKEIINETRGLKASKYVEKNNMLKISNKIFFVFAKK
jgi:ubiquinone/menaquinone biosynthesis C-methylase UbiE